MYTYHLLRAMSLAALRARLFDQKLCGGLSCSEHQDFTQKHIQVLRRLLPNPGENEFTWGRTEKAWLIKSAPAAAHFRRAQGSESPRELDPGPGSRPPKLFGALGRGPTRREPPESSLLSSPQRPQRSGLHSQW